MLILWQCTILLLRIESRIEVSIIFVVRLYRYAKNGKAQNQSGLISDCDLACSMMTPLVTLGEGEFRLK